MKTLRIAFVGKPNSGQWEAAVYLWRHYKFKRVRFMDGPKRLCKFLYNAGVYQRYSWQLLRDIYDALYKIDPSIWASYIENRLKTTTNNVVVYDAHYLNEVEHLRKLGFILIRLSAPKANRAHSIGRFLGKKVHPGTVVISEYFNTDTTKKLQVDYSIYFETKETLYKTLNELIQKLQNS